MAWFRRNDPDADASGSRARAGGGGDARGGKGGRGKGKRGKGGKSGKGGKNGKNVKTGKSGKDAGRGAGNGGRKDASAAPPEGEAEILTPEQRSEILAVALVALAFFLLLALLPVELFGPRADDWFPSGNVIGVAGGTARALLFAAVGVAAFTLPFLLLFGGLRTGGWISGSRAVRLSLLALGTLVLLPPFLLAAGSGPGAAGWLGEATAGYLLEVLGTFGTLLFIGVLFVFLSIGTLGWNPVLALAGGGVRGVAATGRGVGRAVSGTLRLLSGGSRRDGTAARIGDGGAAAGEGAADAAAVAFGGGEPGGPFGGAGAGAGVDADAGAGTPLAGGDGGTDAAGADGRGRGRGGDAARPTAGRRATGRTDDDDAHFPDPTDPRDLAGGDLPPLELLTAPERRDRQGMDRELDALGQVLVEKLGTFNVESTIAGRTTGPVVTQYEVVPAPGVKVNKIANLDADLALAMRAQTIRIVAPIPGKGAVGVEIPNPKPEVVELQSILGSRAYRSSRADLPLALGEDLRGNAYVGDLTKMPHALIAGATGAGKSVCLNTIITSLVYRHTPETLRLLLIDPKMVELSTYQDLPHLRHPVVTDPKEAAGVLKWAVLEMERRYALLSENGVRSLAEFNRRVREGVTLRRAWARGEEGDPDRWVYDDGILPFIVLIVDELADLMMTVQGEVEKPLTHLAQKARAIGIHLIVATQRPSVNVITGLIKANFPCRIAFRVASKIDSRTILDQNGADALLGNGDMLFLPPGQGEPIRIQGAFIRTEDTNRVMEWFREQARRRIAELEEKGTVPGKEEEDILDQVRSHEAQEAMDAGFGEEGFGEWDELFRTAAEVCIQQDQGSTSLLQRKLRIGYGRAARIVDQLHDAGVLGPPDGSKPREVLMTQGEVDAMFSPKRPADEGTEESRVV